MWRKPRITRDEDQRRIADAGEPAAGHEGVQIGVVGVFGEVAVELQRADAERQVERHLGAEDVAAEPAEAAFVIALVEARALLEHLGDGIERQQHRDQQHAPATTATTAMTTMRERCALVRLVSTISASMKAEVRTSPPQAARENASRIASDMMPKRDGVAERLAEAGR